MAGKKIRLFKIASEINIGKETIVAHLQSKGFEVEDKPTTSLTPEMVDVVYDKFKKEKRAAEVQREKVEKQKTLRKQTVEKIKEQKEAEKEQGVQTEPEPEPVQEEKKPKMSLDELLSQIPEEPDDDIIEFEEKQKEEKAVEQTAKKEEVKPKETKPETEQTEKVSETTEATPVEEKKAPQVTKIAGEVSREVGKAPQLRGLKVAGKISIQEEPKPTRTRKRKGQPGEQSEGRSGDNRGGQRRDGNRDSRGPRDGNRDSRGPRDGNRDGRRPRDGNRERQPKEAQFENPADFMANVANERSKEQVQEGEKKFKKRKKTREVVNIAQEVNKKVDPNKKKKRKRSIREQIKEEDVNKAIKQTLAGMSDARPSSRQKARQKKKDEIKEKAELEQIEAEAQEKILEVTEFVTTGDLANMMNIQTNEIILKCMELGLMVTVNQRLDKETLQLIADDYGYELRFEEEEQIAVLEDEEDPEDTLKPRSPIVTIMGHVDHGKTSLLDYIRSAKVVAGESGGITQHIGAYQVEHSAGSHITFLDTPGHEAFTAMRARGAQITDIVVVVVAADDDVMPQTKEAISHAQAAGVPIVVAINKIDKPEANPDKIKQQLSENGILIEEWGGKYQHAEISAKKGTNIDKLLDIILLEAEVLELKANPDRKARGTVVEAHMEKGLGPVATVVIEKGTLRVGDTFVAGTASGKVRAILDERDHKMKEAVPAQPARIVGLSEVPGAGDNLIVLSDESEAKRVANDRAKLKREQEMRLVRHTTLDDISKEISVGGVSNLKIILKTDVGGSLEALSDELLKLSHDEVRVQILHKGVGQISESDVQLAMASEAIIIGFHTDAVGAAKKLATNENVEIRNYEIIYEVIDDVRNALEGMLRPEINEEVVGEAEVRAIFKIGRIQKIAGCMITSGKVVRGSKIKILRDGLPVYNGVLSSLKREKDDAKEVREGFECGIMIDGFNEFEEEDIIQSFSVTEVKRTFDK